MLLPVSWTGRSIASFYLAETVALLLALANLPTCLSHQIPALVLDHICSTSCSIAVDTPFTFSFCCGHLCRRLAGSLTWLDSIW